ncbi:phytoene desaturase [Sporormia fimetaria CBS 119925]|uniref:Phytoene desaturase n=1 Tax=Sporormia fimetaria CBS 119925 TaxID=1340428 RepID=A0A6A6UVH8_9PLEO|nr:phytoene desaturase [Sporormia fimetaria CBS 119925]
MGRSEKPSVVIVGAGAGGVATAARMASCGYDVTVVEKNEFTGGRCSLIHKDGYRFDQGPSLLLLPQLFHETFHDLGTSLENEGIELVKCEPNYNVHFHDNERFRLSTDLSEMKTEIERFEGKGGFERYLGFLQEAHRHYENSIVHVLKKNFFTIFSLMRPSFLRYLFALHPFETIYGRASRYFWTDRLRRTFTFASMYMGMSPFDAPGTYSLLQYTELAEGIWYPKGGFWKVVDALVKIGERRGVNYRLNTGVSRILLNDSGNKAEGVVLSSGEELRADLVICNADLIYAYNNLLPSTPYSRSLAKRDASCSSISFYWGMDTQFPQLSAHNIFLAEDYKESFNSIFKDHQIPEQPSFYVNVPSRLDPKAAPAGRDAVIVLVPVGHLLEHNSDAHKGQRSQMGDQKATQDWDAMVANARETVLRTIEARLNIKLGPHIVSETINTPPTWKAAFNLDRGAILGLSHSFFNVLSFRPKTWHAGIKNLYFVGASTHPGTGVPIVLAGAKIVVEQICEAVGRRTPWSQGGQGKKEVRKLDRTQWMPVVEWVHWVYALLIAAFVWLASRAVETLDARQGKFVGDW